MKNLVRILILFVFLSCNTSEKKNQDVEHELFKIDSLKIGLLIKELIDYQTDNNDSLILFGNNIVIKYPKNKGYVNEQVAHVFYRKSKFFLAKNFFKKSATNYKQENNKIRYAEQLTNIGVLEEMLGNYPEAIHKYNDALILFNTQHLEIKTSYVYNNLGVVYLKLKKYKQALFYYKRSLAICQRINRDDLKIGKLNNIGSLFELYDHNLDSALFYYNQAYNLCVDLNIYELKNLVEANIANIYIQQGKFKSADSLLKKVEFYSIKNNLDLTNVFKYKADMYLKQKKYAKAEITSKKVIDLAKKQGYKENELYGLNQLIENYKRQKKFKQAFIAQTNYYKLNDELIGFKQKQIIEQLNIKYGVQEKDNKIKLLEIKEENNKRKNIIFYIITIIIVLFLLILLYVFSLQKKHSKLLIKSMQYDITDYIKQLHNFEDEIHEHELTHKQLFLQKIKQFNLTEREEEVLLYISQGLKNTEISEKMFVSINTTKTHIKNIFVKMDVRNRIEATNKAKLL